MRTLMPCRDYIGSADPLGEERDVVNLKFRLRTINRAKVLPVRRRVILGVALEMNGDLDAVYPTYLR